MPEMVFRVRWPDASVQQCYSPSTVVEEFFVPGTSYPVAEFVVRSRTALTQASERVRRTYGFACAQAAAQLADIEARAKSFADGAVLVEGFER